MEWLVIGSSPTVIDWIGQITANRIITCNSGLKLIPAPHYYLCTDRVASHKFAQLARIAQRHGTHLITLNREPSALVDRDVDWYDEFLVISDHGSPTRSQYGKFGYTGPLCVEYACHHGARTIHLIGMDGYRHDEDYFDPGQRKKPATPRSEHTSEIIAPRMRQLATVWHDVEFRIYGNPCYHVEASNWETVSQP